ncbi:hypothetical protein EVAR_100179_1 [Eumeta japonica]|uniref:Uncharacterized protein n=1 Tax=Eumeta variegata TaxID=151549 RepID=A0A4C2A749_EUMVA|nr:hypothetical protein EVAR_100179_1 [Eumeta japonica]
MCKLITIKCDESEARGARGSDPIGRAVRDARTGRRPRSAHSAVIASAARHSQSAFNRRRGNTLYPSSETKFWSALRPPGREEALLPPSKVKGKIKSSQRRRQRRFSRKTLRFCGRRHFTRAPIILLTCRRLPTPLVVQSSVNPVKQVTDGVASSTLNGAKSMAAPKI